MKSKSRNPLVNGNSCSKVCMDKCDALMCPLGICAKCGKWWLQPLINSRPLAKHVPQATVFLRLITMKTTYKPPPIK